MIFIVIFQDMAIILLTMMGKDDKLSLADIDFRDVAFRREGNDLIMYKAEGNVLSIGHKMVLHSGTGLKKSQVISLITR